MQESQKPQPPETTSLAQNTESAFSAEDFICDSSLHIGEIVEHTTSWLTINPVLGCQISDRQTKKAIGRRAD